MSTSEFHSPETSLLNKVKFVETYHVPFVSDNKTHRLLEIYIP